METTELFFTAAQMFHGGSCKIMRLTRADQSGGQLHAHDYMQIWYVVKGTCRHSIDQKEQRMVSGEAFILPPLIAHQTELDFESEAICCEFSMEPFLAARDAKEQGLLDVTFLDCFMVEQEQIRPKFALSTQGQQRVEQLLIEMLEEYQRGDGYSQQLLRVHILHLLLLFAREYHGIPEKEESVALLRKYKAAMREGISYLEGHFHEDVHLEAICRHAAVSKTYFCYLFKLLTQQTFIEYLTNLRIKKAVELLEQTDLSISAICYKVGFNDPTHFSRTFKKLLGVSARRYRATH